MRNGPLREVPEMRCLSVLLAVYNVEGFIRASVDSILHQDFNDYELIIVDDGSTDQSGKICDEYAKCHPRISVIHKNNGGLSTARNAGIDVARGKYIVFVDADDTLPPGALASMAERAVTADADVVVFSFTTVKNGKRIETHVVDGKRYDADFALRKLLRYDMPMTSWGKTYRRRIFDKIRFDPAAKMGQDTLFNITCAAKLKCSFVFADVCVYNYVLRESSISFSGRFYEKYLKLSSLVEAALQGEGVYEAVAQDFAVFDAINVLQAAFKARRCPARELIDRLLENRVLWDERFPAFERKILGYFAGGYPIGCLYLHYRFARMRLKQWLVGF